VDRASDRGRVDLIDAVPTDTVQRRWPVPFGRRIIVLIVFVVAAAALGYMIRHQWFYYDEWAYLDPQVEGRGKSLLTWLFVPHNEHTIVWTRLWFQISFRAVGLHHYWVYAIPLLASVLAAGYAAYVLMRRLGGSQALALVGVVPFLFMGAGAQDLVWAGQFQFVLPVALFLGWLALDISGRLPTRSWARIALPIAWSLVGALSSLVWIPLALVLTVRSLILRQWWYAALLTAVPGLTWGISRVVYPHTSSSAYAAHGISEYLHLIPRYIWVGVVSPFATTVHSWLGGFVLVALAGLGVLVFLRAGLRSLVTAAALAVAAPLFLMITGYARLQMGPEQAASSRYSYVVLACLLPLLVAGLARILRLPRREGKPKLTGLRQPGLLLGVAVVLVFGFFSAMALQTYSHKTAVRDRASQRVIQAAAGQLAAESPEVATRSGLPEPDGAPQLTAFRLQSWVLAGKVATKTIPAAARQAAVNLTWSTTRKADAPITGACRVVAGPGSVAITSVTNVSRKGAGAVQLRPTGPSVDRSAVAVHSLPDAGSFVLSPLGSQRLAAVLGIHAGVTLTLC
jgi:hypothetical protein